LTANVFQIQITKNRKSKFVRQLVKIISTDYTYGNFIFDSINN